MFISSEILIVMMMLIIIFMILFILGAVKITSKKSQRKKLEKIRVSAIEKALAESEAMYRLIAKNMTDLLVVLDIHGIVWYASSSHKMVLGINDEEMVGTSAIDYVYPDDLDYVRREIMRIDQIRTDQQLRFRLQHVDGYPIYVDSLMTPIFDSDGKVERIVVVSRDVTDKVEIERELIESEERYRRLIELSPQPMASHRDGRFVYINPAGVALLGAASSDEIIGNKIFDIIHPDFREMVEQMLKLVLEKNYAGSIEHKIIRLDGQFIEVESTSLYDEKTQSFLVVFNDISERKKMERALRESKERYRRLVELSPVSITVYKDNQFIYVNPAGMNVVGAKQLDDIIGSRLSDWVHPNDHDIATERLRNTIINGYSSPQEYQIIRMDSRVVDVTVTSIFDSQSDSVELLFEDITARKQAERALLESEELNRRLIELSPEAIVLHSDYKFIYVNPAGVTLFGEVQLSDLVGRSIFDYIHPDFNEKVASRLAEVYKHQSKSPLVEQKLIHSDGSIVDVEVIATTIPYRGNNAGLTIFRDISERKRAEENRARTEQKIRESEELYFRLQTSLDRFSHDLFGVMKVSELERRLVKEVQEIMEITNVSLVEVDLNHNVVIKSGHHDISENIFRDKSLKLRKLPVCEIINTTDGCFLKIGEIQGKSYLLSMSGKPLSLEVTSKRVWLQTITRYVSVLFDNFRLIEDLTNELEQLASQQVAPSWLLRLLFNLSENERKNLSQDLHDAALQEQIIWYRKLDDISTDRSLPQDYREKLQQITQGLLDVIYQIRITCNEIRPPMLKEEGLVSSLEALFEFTQLRSNYSIEFDSADFQKVINDDMLIGIYRIVQELLANATKHSNASRVHITLFSQPEQIQLIYEDNGIGMDLSEVVDSFKSMGVYGMKERVRSMDGKIEFHSSPSKGVNIFIFIPTLSTVHNYEFRGA